MRLKLLIKLLVFSCFIACVGLAGAQHVTLKGVVLDKETREPLPFVNIIGDDARSGTATDIDGRFALKLTVKPSVLKLTYVGYHPKTHELGSELQAIEIFMVPMAYGLREVKILPGINPAERIIKGAIENRNMNDPLSNNSFSYDSYNKTRYYYEIAEAWRLDSMLKSLDSSDMNLARFLRNELIFMNESVIESHYKKPGKKKDFVKAVHTSGFKSAEIYTLPTQFQPLGFYETYINIFEKYYLNPISPGSLNKYIFELKDTLYDKSDTVFVISYQPKKGSNFDGFKGVISIHSERWAIKNVIAESADNALSTFLVQQQYEFIDNESWFPVQLNADLKFDSLMARIEHRSYLKNITFEAPTNKRIFNYLTAETEADAADRDSIFWNQVRPNVLTEQEQLTFHVMDSLNEELNLDQYLQLSKYLVQGFVPIGPLQIDLKRLYRFNNYEKYRFGFGLSTSDNLSRYFSVGGYGAYGTNDRTWKYGAHGQLNFDRKKNTFLRLSYASDLLNPGKRDFYSPIASNEVQIKQNRAIQQMLKQEIYDINLNSRVLKYIVLEIGAAQMELEELGGYQFQTSTMAEPTTTFSFSETTIRARYLHQEQLAFVLGRLFSYSSRYPLVQMNYTKGWQVNNLGAYSYERVMFRLQQTFVIRGLGRPTLAVEAGKTWGDLPRAQLFIANGTAAIRNTLDRPFTFQTMQPYEFLTTDFLALFYRHPFGQLKLKTKYSNPHFILANSFIIGRLSNPEFHLNSTSVGLEKGFNEAGLLIDQLIKMPMMNYAYFSFGVGVYYRYGAYTLPQWMDNAALKLSFGVTF